MSRFSSRVRSVPNRVGRQFASLAARREQRGDLVRLGSDYGGWWVPAGLIGEESVCYLAGVGEDVSFDLALIEQFDCKVWALDPTPRSIKHVASIVNDRFKFLPVGLWDKDSTMRFFEPANPAHVSHSITNIQGTSGTGFDAECKTVGTIMAELGHSMIDLLKLDIEGAEVNVIDWILVNNVQPRVLCVEFDAVEAPWWLARRLRRLSQIGYRLCRKEGRNYTFVFER